MSAMGEFRKEVPILNIYLNRRIVNRYTKTMIRGKIYPVRKGMARVRGRKAKIFTNLPRGCGIAECRSLVIQRSDVPRRCRISTLSSSNTIVKVSRGTLPVCNIRFRPRTILARCKRRLLRGFYEVTRGFRGRRWGCMRGSTGGGEASPVCPNDKRFSSLQREAQDDISKFLPYR